MTAGATGAPGATSAPAESIAPLDPLHAKEAVTRAKGSYTAVTDVGVAALGNVHTLNLSDTEVTDVGAVALGNVHMLSLSTTNITDVGAAALGAPFVAPVIEPTELEARS